MRSAATKMQVDAPVKVRVLLSIWIMLPAQENSYFDLNERSYYMFMWPGYGVQVVQYISELLILHYIK